MCVYTVYNWMSNQESNNFQQNRRVNRLIGSRQRITIIVQTEKSFQQLRIIRIVPEESRLSERERGERGGKVRGKSCRLMSMLLLILKLKLEKFYSCQQKEYEENSNNKRNWWSEILHRCKHTPVYSYVCMACMFFQVHFAANLRIFFRSLRPAKGFVHTHTGAYAHFDPSPLMDRCTHVLLIFLPIPGQQWHVGKSCAYEAKTISCQCCFIFGQKAKVGREFLWHGPHTHTCIYTGDTQAHTRTHTWDKANKVIATKQCCQTAENMTLPAQQSLITVGCDRDRNIIFDILDIHMYTLCKVFPFLLAAFFLLGVKM